MTVSPETAILASELGFDEPCREAYDLEHNLVNSSIYYNGNEFFQPEDILNAIENSEGQMHYLFPEQHDLQRWLREQKKIRIFVTNSAAGEFKYEIYVLNPVEEDRIGKPWERKNYYTSFRSYEYALEQGLLESLKILQDGYTV